MTCIAGIVHEGKVWLGADRLCSGGNGVKYGLKNKKIWSRIIGGTTCIFGQTGGLHIFQIIEHMVDFPDEDVPADDSLVGFLVRKWIPALRTALDARGEIGKNKTNGTDSMDASFLLGVHGRLLLVNGGFSVAEPDLPYAAIGSGGDTAFGALFATAKLESMGPKERLRLALKAAAAHLTTVGTDFDFVRT